MSDRPIGVFDSGVGGLTVASAIQELMPSERIMYLGDTAHVPYGNKSAETIVRYSDANTRFLTGKNVKAVVVACNTATAHALGYLQEQFPLPVLGVIEPGVAAALAATKTGRIGIIGTPGTIQSGAYQQALLRHDPALKITATATPLLVSLVEEDWLQHAATHLILAQYLGPFLTARVDTLVLACTHYPLLKGMIRTVMGDDVALVDSADNMAQALRGALESKNLRRAETASPEGIKMFVTDLSPSFEPLARRFLRDRMGTIEKVSFE